MKHAINLVSVILFLISSFALASQELNLEAGFYRYGDSITMEKKSLIWDLEDIASEHSINQLGSIISGVKFGEGNKWSVLSDTLNVGVIDLSSGAVPSSWPLTRWRNQYATPEIKERYKEFYRGEYPKNEYTIKKLWAPGCFQNSPLRYGDIDADGVDELVLFLGSDFVVFSPEKKKIIFAENFRLDDWLPKDQTDQELESKFYPDPSPYQYISGILSDTPDVEAGYRGYSKLYFGDFDDDDNPDILVWRKLYISRASDDSVDGFKKVRDGWQHFRRNSDGEYMPQDTQATQVQSWLQGNNLTWQKGFPSKSECVGEEGELIPEMHDPLLNDPDVSQ